MIRASLAMLAPLVQDSGAAYVPKAGGPPDTSAYMWAGYLIAATVYVGYLTLLLRRVARENRLAAREGASERPFPR
jgi:hypothetical protein